MTDSADFPWHLGVYDSHCHPTDTVDQLKTIPGMRARVLVVMATRTQDQSLVAEAHEKYGVDSQSDEQRHGMIPAFGHHPWFSYKFSTRKKPDDKTDAQFKTEHYQQVLTPQPDDDFIQSLPQPLIFANYLEEVEQNLHKFPTALVGEIGLDKSFRIPEAWTQDVERDTSLTPGGREGRRLTPYRVNIDHQKQILQAQLRTAAKLHRAVSVHGVQAHGVLYDTLAQIWKEKSPPRICLHSYSGTAETVKQYTSAPCDVYFSFSITINTWAEKVEAAARAVPDDRIVIESDLHVAGEKMDECLEAAARKVCEVKAWSLEDGVARLARNWKRFVGWHDEAETINRT